MEKIIKYKSIDGKVFETEEECIKHETILKYQNYINDFEIFDENYKKLDFTSACPDDVYYINIKTKAAADFIGEWFEDNGCFAPCDGHDEKIGVWVYDFYGIAEWVNLTETSKKINEIIDKIKGGE
jgi:hypothetical protein